MFSVPLRQKLDAGEPVVGVLATQADASLAETIGLLGFDFFMLDCEHGAASPRDAEAVVLGCERRGITPLARIGTADPKAILQFLDAGLAGVMMPGITTADQVQALVDAVKYPPLGTRGLGPVRAASFMLGAQSQADYVAQANRQTVVLPQIEDVACLAALDDLLSVDGVDGFVIGPRDFAMSMGFTDGPGHPEVREALDEVERRVIESGKLVGTVAGTGAQARALVERGVRFVLTSLTALLKPSAAAFRSGMHGDA